jgi:uncharacterized protein (TIGR03083 family)
MTDVRDIEPIGKAEGGRLLATAYERLLALLRLVDDWAGPTDCTAWTVRDVVGHLVGNAEFFSSVPRMLSWQVRGTLIARRKGYGAPFDGVNDLQIERHAALSDAEALAALERVVPKALRYRQRLPGLVRATPVPVPGMGLQPLSFLYDRVMTRDVVMHSLDVAHPRGMAVAIDERVVADVVREWARRAQPCTLVVGGTTYEHGSGGPVLTYDTVDFLRRTAGRAPAEGVLGTGFVMW